MKLGRGCGESDISALAGNFVDGREFRVGLAAPGAGEGVFTVVAAYFAAVRIVKEALVPAVGAAGIVGCGGEAGVDAVALIALSRGAPLVNREGPGPIPFPIVHHLKTDTKRLVHLGAFL